VTAGADEAETIDIARSSMDWIERLLHVSPDGGNGTVELVFYVVAAAAVALTGGTGWRLRRARRRR
jgi:hypothetical protein